MQACKTHVVGTQRRKTHRIAGVLIILGCISGVYVSGKTTPVTSKSAEVTVDVSLRDASQASKTSAGGAGAPAASVHRRSPGGNRGGVAGARSASVATDGGLDGITGEKTVAMLFITGETTVGDLFKQLYEKAKSEYERTKSPEYDWSGPQIIRIIAEDSKIVHELHGHMYNEKLKDVFGNHANLIITRGEPVDESELTITNNQENNQVFTELMQSYANIRELRKEKCFLAPNLSASYTQTMQNDYVDKFKRCNKNIQKESQAIYDKLVELTHLKNRPKEWVDHNIMVEYQGTIQGLLTVVIIPLRSGQNIKITTDATQKTIKWQYLSNNAFLNVNEDKTTSIEEVDSSLYQNSLKYEWIRWFLSEKGDGDVIIRILCQTQGCRGRTQTCKYLLHHKTDFQKYVLEKFKVEGQKFTKSQEIFDFVTQYDEYEPRLNKIFFDFILNEIRNSNKKIITFHKMVGNSQMTANITINKSDTEALIREVKNEFPELQNKLISVKLYYSNGSRKKTLYIEEGNSANGYLRTWLNEKDIYYKVDALIGDMLKVTVTGDNNESRTIKTSTIHSISEFISQVKVAFGIQERDDKCLILVPASITKEKLDYPAKIEPKDIIADNCYYNRYSDCWGYI